MPCLHFPVACLLALLQARAAAGMLNDTIPSPTPDSEAVSHAFMPGITATSSDPSEVNTTKSRGAEENDYICENDWFRYSVILAATGGGSLLLSVVILTITCCCGRRRSRHISLDHEDIELGEKKAAVQVVGAVEETALIANKAAMNVAPEQDGVKFTTPPDMESVAAEGAGTGTSKEWRDNSTSGSDLNRCESPADKTMENESEGIQGN
ncbi:uncharacterized protein [Ambystoma mexicanum]|uniref:uncharacterized protein n=1 Tax=Ambystoma mexicanum TaxID=8296 RepID=UPI0037E711AC